MSTPNASTLVINMTKPVNPTWLQEDIIDVGMMPAHAWAKASASGPQLDYTQPGEREEDLGLPQRPGQVGEHLRY